MLRLDKDYTQEYVANEMSISQYAYSKIERGITILNVAHLYALARIFDVHFTAIRPKTKASAALNTRGLMKYWEKLLEKTTDAKYQN